MADYYIFNDHITLDPPRVYSHPEFIKTLNNAVHDQVTSSYRASTRTYAVIHNGHDMQLVRQPSGEYILEFNASSFHYLSRTELAQLKHQSKNWFTSARHYESYPDQTRVMAEANCLGTEIKLDIKTEPIPPYHRPSHLKSHSTHAWYGSGRVGHPQHTFARDNHQSRTERFRLARLYPEAQVRHINRRYSRRHPIDFPVFDDNEYIESRHSTNWKHSHKWQHQWGGNSKGPLDKHQLSHQLNDWTTKDEFEAHGGDYYAPDWWADLPDPNRTPMNNKYLTDAQTEIANGQNKNCLPCQNNDNHGIVINLPQDFFKKASWYYASLY